MRGCLKRQPLPFALFLDEQGAEFVQCKQWKIFKVGVKTVREMFGVMAHEKADRVIIVASGTYTDDAVAFAKGKPILLIDGKALVKLIRSVKGEQAADTCAFP